MRPLPAAVVPAPAPAAASQPPVHFAHQVLVVQALHIAWRQLVAEQVHQPGLAATDAAPQVDSAAGLQPEPVGPATGRTSGAGRLAGGVACRQSASWPSRASTMPLRRIIREGAALHRALIALLQRLRGTQGVAGAGSRPECRDGYVRETPGEVRRDLLDQVHRTMLAAGAADGNGEVAAVAGLVFRNARLDEARDVRDQPRHGVAAFQEARDFRVAPGEAAQFRLPVGIRQRARVEHEVRVARDAVLEAEGLEQDRDPALLRARRRGCGSFRAGRARPCATYR